MQVKFVAAAFIALAALIVAFLFLPLGPVLHDVLQTGIDIQRDFTRDLAQHLRDVKEGGPSAHSSLVLALGLAFTYGVVHALGPGHGKFVVTTYFMAHERRIGRGVLMGLQIAVMHVISAIVIVLVAHYLAMRAYGRTGDMPALRTASYASIALVGSYMLWRALKSQHSDHDHASCGHDHGHEHGDRGRQGLLSFTVGIAPCSGAVLLLIYAFANDIVPLGILMTVAIAAGMAITMIGLGLFSILARRFVLRQLAKRERASTLRLGPVVELAGACLIILFGVGMTVASL